MKAYAGENEGRYPDPNQWCDLLLQRTDIDADRFLCRAIKWRWRRQVLPWPIPKNEGCYYAMNPNCEPNSPDDTVLLFEIAGGWNISGGAELMAVENHRGSGGSVLVNGGYAMANGMHGRVEPERQPVQPDLAAEVGVNPGQNLDERALACSVFARQDVHLSRFAVEGDVREDLHP